VALSSTTPNRTNTAEAIGAVVAPAATVDEPKLPILVFTKRAGTPLFDDSLDWLPRRHVGRSVNLTWFELVTLLYRSISPCDPSRFPDLDIAKRGAGAWAAGLYRGNHRHGSTFISTSIMTFDADKGGDVGRLVDVLERSRVIVHSTCKYRPEEPRARIILMLAAPCSSIGLYKLAHARIRDWLQSKIAGLVIDRAASDGPRLNFFPMYQPGVDPRFAVTSGKPLDLTTLGAARPPRRTTAPRATMKPGQSYAAAALRRARNAVCAASDGARHTTLTKEAWSLARPELELAVEDVEAVLLPVYHDEADGKRTVRDQFRARRSR
jgi:hypothetical protein